MLNWVMRLFWGRDRRRQPEAADHLNVPSPVGRAEHTVANSAPRRQLPATGGTRYAVLKQPTLADGYPQRIPMWEAVERLGTATADELLMELLRNGYRRPRAQLDRGYCQHELTDMCRKGFMRRVD